MRERRLDSPASGAALDREAELGVELAGRDVVVRVGLDPGRQAEHDRRACTLRHDLAKQLELVLAVDDDRRAAAERGPQVVDALVVAEEMDAVARIAGPQRQVELARGHDVQAETLVRDDPEEARRRERLCRVQDLARRPHRGDVLACALPHRLLVVDVEGRAVAARELDDITTADLHAARGVDPVRDREQQARGLVRRSARAGAATCAAAPARLGPEVRTKRFATRRREARHQHAGLGRLARRANLRLVPLGELRQHIEPLSAIAPILVDGHPNAGF